MLSDLAKFDLVNLVLAETWSEEKQADMVLRFTAAMAGYLEENLSQYFDEKTDQEFRKLMTDPKITPQKVVQFYKNKIPNLEKNLDILFLQFKRLFLLKVYESKVKELKQEIEGFKEASKRGRDEIRLRLFQIKEQELADWEQVLLYAKNDEWDKAYQTLQKISH